MTLTYITPIKEPVHFQIEKHTQIHLQTKLIFESKQN